MLRTTPSLRSGSRWRFAARAELVLEVPEFGEERLLAVDVLVELLGSLGGGAEGGLLGPQLVEAGFLQADLGLDVVEQGLEEDVLVEPVVVEPEGVVLLRRLEQPVDRGLAAALGVARDVVVPEAARRPACGSSPAGPSRRGSRRLPSRWRRPGPSRSLRGHHGPGGRCRRSGRGHRRGCRPSRCGEGSLRGVCCRESVVPWSMPGEQTGSGSNGSGSSGVGRSPVAKRTSQRPRTQPTV